MKERASHLRNLLSDDGSMFIHIDDNEIGYLIVLLDEIFGRENRISIITFKQGSATGHKAINPGVVTTTNYVLIYAKNKAIYSPNKVFTARGRDERYSQFINNYDDHYENWNLIPLSKAVAKSLSIEQRLLKKTLGIKYDGVLDDFVLKNAHRVIQLARPDYKSVGKNVRAIIDASNECPEKVFLHQRENHHDMFFLGGRRFLFYKNKLKKIDGQLVAGEPLTNLWHDLLSNNLHNEGGVVFPKSKKPESLVKRVFELASDYGDLVLDSFLGSGTTAAVAQKMGRKYIGIELGDHCNTHCLPRLRKVCDGTDQGGISKAVNWKGGGGFKYYDLAPSILEKDHHDNWIINKKYNPNMLAAAMARQEGFKYQPDDTIYWKQGRSTEKDFIFTTTEFVTQEHVDKIESEMGEDESLLICCKAHNVSTDKFENITIKKIPLMLLGRCEFGKDDYSFNIVTMPIDEDEPDFIPIGPEEKESKTKKTKEESRQMNIFDGGIK